MLYIQKETYRHQLFTFGKDSVMLERKARTDINGMPQYKAFITLDKGDYNLTMAFEFTDGYLGLSDIAKDIYQFAKSLAEDRY